MVMIPPTTGRIKELEVFKKMYYCMLMVEHCERMITAGVEQGITGWLDTPKARDYMDRRDRYTNQANMYSTIYQALRMGTLHNAGHYEMVIKEAIVQKNEDTKNELFQPVVNAA